MKLLRRQTKRLLKNKKSNSINQVAMFSATVASTAIVVSQNTIASAQTKQEAFLEEIVPIATKLAANNNLYASVMIAQAALESNWGTSKLASEPNYNLFGIKGSYKGQSVIMETLEDNGTGATYKISATFRKYPSYLESLQNYVDLLKNGLKSNSNFYSGTWMSNTNSYTDVTSFLTGRYATDISYGSKLNRLINQYNLTKYDVKNSNGASVISKSSDGTNSNNTINDNTNSYVVVKGDYLYKIATAYKMTVDELKKLNNLSSNLIFAGQVLKVNAVTNSSTNTNAAQEKVVEKQNTTYTVKYGDYLYKIARENGLSLNELKSMNNLSSNTIYVNQVLVIKKSNNNNSNISTNSTSTKSTVDKTYVVKRGDSVWRIANIHKISMDQLKKLNNLKSNLIHPGQVLKVS